MGDAASQWRGLVHEQKNRWQSRFACPRERAAGYPPLAGMPAVGGVWLQRLVRGRLRCRYPSPGTWRESEAFRRSGAPARVPGWVKGRRSTQTTRHGMAGARRSRILVAAPLEGHLAGQKRQERSLCRWSGVRSRSDLPQARRTTWATDRAAPSSTTRWLSADRRGVPSELEPTWASRHAILPSADTGIDASKVTRAPSGRK